MENYNIIEEVEENDPRVDKFFDGDVIDVEYWVEGKGRGESHYEIFKSGDEFILRAEHGGFDGTFERYYFITIKP
jgi:hypothetical protein